MANPVARGRSFRKRLALALMLTSGAAVAVVALLLAIASYADVRREAVEAARTQAEVIALNSGAALLFGDRIHGEQTLGLLRVVPDVAAATLYDATGETFASYRREGEAGPLPEAGDSDEWHAGRWLYITRPVVDQGQLQGRLVLAYDLARVRGRLRTGVAIALLVVCAAMGIAYLMSGAVQRLLAAPIQELSRVANAVSSTHDYSLRAARLSEDELGQLTNSFNQMLSRIEEQERELQASNEARGQLLESERVARAEAEHASRMKDEFVATLSHELRTPLTPILGWLSILRRVGTADEQTRKGLEVIERNARHQTQMIEDLLDMSRIVSGKIHLDVRDVRLEEVIEAAMATVRPAAEARGIDLHAVFDANAGPMRGDPDRLQQVVWNLLSNAIKFTERDGRVQVTLERVGSHLEIAVRDTGVGIPRDFLPHVFDRFRQLDSSVSRRHGGLGLGLAIVRQLVELHGGTVRAESAGEGRGSTFTVELPVLVVRAADAAGGWRHAGDWGARGSDGDAPSLERIRILLVDDDRDARELLSRLLEEAGATVDLAASAEEALEKLATSASDVLISDIGMPIIDGYELIRRIRALPKEAGSGTPAIALTAFARAEDRTKALRAGYQLHIAKPVQLAELVSAVASLGRRPKPGVS